MVESQSPATLPDETHIGRVALRVSNLAETNDFYQNVVGLELMTRDGATATLGVDGTPLLVLKVDEEAQKRHPREAGLYHTAFRVPSREALGDGLRRVNELWQLDGAADHLVSEALYVTDPEGNGVELYRDFPREKWPRADDGRVQMATDPLNLASLETAVTGASELPVGSDIGHIHLEVSSLEAFKEFYVETVGFEQQTEFPGASFVSAGGYHHHLGANTWHHRSEPVAGRGLSWFEVVVPESSALHAVQERLEAHGVTVTETDDGFDVADSDGIRTRFRVQ